MSNERVIKFAQTLLQEDPPEAISPTLIGERIDQVLLFQPHWKEGFDRDAAIRELVRRFSMWIGSDAAIKSEAGHVPWLTSLRKTDWRYWRRYQQFLEHKMSYKAVDALDRSTDKILDLLEDPQREGPWDRRGLVVGHVQSGKTGNYTGLICKAADAGYKIVIVLAGLHNNLRAQTQMRLDEGFLGYETGPRGTDMPIIGVGKIDSDQSIRPNYVTDRTERGDFSTARSRSLGITPEQRPWLFVVKKNKTVLTRLLTWIRDHVADTQATSGGRRVVTKLPLLLIDDEADHASVDTGEQSFLEDGTPDQEHEPKAINSLIRKLLISFTRSAYVGFTATPFANIFIHERGETREEGPDLFPSSFIINLAAPSNYVGPAQVFGLSAPEGRTKGLPLYREADDYDDWMPQSHKNGHMPLVDGQAVLPDSLQRAVHSFIITCAVRELRGQGADHSSMLVHVTRFTSVQKAVYQQVDDLVRHLKQRLTRKIGNADLEGQLKSLWDNDFVPTTRDAREDFPAMMDGVADVQWPDVIERVRDIISDIEVRMINGTAKDVLDYSVPRAQGLRIIAVGGDKLSRGLTLEGLCTSYFLRTSKMYDTLMQMGRWFGYRPGYIDVCRLYTTPELVEWFGHIADAAEELREEFDLMVASGATPREFGLKVQSHPVMTVTSQLKMRSAHNLLLSFSGSIVETTALRTGEADLQRNLAALRQLVGSLPGGEANPTRKFGGRTQKWNGHFWANVTGEAVANFLENYVTHPAAYKVNSVSLAMFVRTMMAEGELLSWNVALVGGGEDPFEVVPGKSVNMMQRRSAADQDEAKYSIGRLLSPRDETIDLSEQDWEQALAKTRAEWKPDLARLKNPEPPSDPSGYIVREIRGSRGKDAAHDRRALLLLYVLDTKASGHKALVGAEPVVAFGISFPKSESGVKVQYRVNNVAWEQEYAGAN